MSSTNVLHQSCLDTNVGSKCKEQQRDDVVPIVAVHVTSVAGKVGACTGVHSGVVV